MALLLFSIIFKCNELFSSYEEKGKELALHLSRHKISLKKAIKKFLDVIEKKVFNRFSCSCFTSEGAPHLAEHLYRCRTGCPAASHLRDSSASLCSASE
jgi:hypothetical protein